MLDLTELETAYRGSNPNPLWTQPGWTRARNTLYAALRTALLAELRDLAAYALRALPLRKQDVPARAEGAFNIVNARAVQWADREAARLVVQVDEETKRAIRALVTQMQRGNLTVQQAARELRQLVGLTTQQAMAVHTFRRKLEARAGLLDDIAAERAALTPAQRKLVGARVADTQARIDRLVDRYERRTLRYRTEMIARTESMRAANAGQQEAWKAARDDGLIPAGQVQKWLVTPDERLCSICAPMENVTTPLGQPFTHPVTYAQYEAPPIHPSCRCAVGLVIDDTFSSEDEALAREIRVNIR